MYHHRARDLPNCWIHRKTFLPSNVKFLMPWIVWVNQLLTIASELCLGAFEILNTKASLKLTFVSMIDSTESLPLNASINLVSNQSDVSQQTQKSRHSLWLRNCCLFIMVLTRCNKDNGGNSGGMPFVYAHSTSIFLFHMPKDFEL